MAIMFQAGTWAITHNTIRAKVVGIGERNRGITSHTGLYIPGASPHLLWTSPEPPQYVKERALQSMRRLRRAEGAPV